MTWTYFGHLQEADNDPSAAEPTVDTDTIIKILTGQGESP
jgi:hypothetical protein